MATVQQALANPASSIHAKLKAARETQQHNARIIERLMAEGLTREQAWAKALAS